MANNAVNIDRRDSLDHMDYDLLWAAENGDIDHAGKAIQQNENCIKDQNDLGMNALQLAVIHLHDDMALYLLQNTDISARNKDVYGRDAFKMALICGSPELIVALDERWSQERHQEFVNRRSKVVGLTPKP
jgi:ankyrin repeat protein